MRRKSNVYFVKTIQAPSRLNSCLDHCSRSIRNISFGGATVVYRHASVIIEWKPWLRLLLHLVPALQLVASRRLRAMKKNLSIQNHQLMTINEAAAQLSISRSSIYRLIGGGHLESVHIGRSVRITSMELDAYVSRISSAQQLRGMDFHGA